MTVRNVAGHCSSTQSSRNLETDAGFWRAKCLDGGTSRRRQVDAGGAPAEPAAAHDRRRNAYFRGAAVCQHVGFFTRAMAAATVPRAPSFVERSGAGGRAQSAAAGRDHAGASRRAVSRRNNEVRSSRIGDPARTARSRTHHHLAGNAAGRFPRSLPADRRRTPVRAAGVGIRTVAADARRKSPRVICANFRSRCWTASTYRSSVPRSRRPNSPRG